MERRLLLAMTIVRLGVALAIGMHGWSRTLKGDVPGFGDYLAGEGIPAGHVVAWAISLFEMAGTTLLAIGRYVRVVAPLHICILVTGIIMVHGQNGWYVVGAGRNGVEFSVLLIICLTAIFVAGKTRVS